MKSNERLLATGASGSGKSYLAAHLTKDWPHLIAFDEKATLKIPRAKILTSIKDLRAARGGRYIFRPDPLAMGDKESRAALLDKFFRIIYDRHNTVLFIDEIYAVAESALSTPPALRAIITRGRERNIGVVALAQRPAMIPLFFMSEAEHLITFRLSLAKDRKRIAEFMGDDLDFADLGEFEFFYHHINSADPPAKLKI